MTDHSGELVGVLLLVRREELRHLETDLREVPGVAVLDVLLSALHEPLRDVPEIELHETLAEMREDRRPVRRQAA
jgi:hypothetical protein